ncbi:hypothetical protein HanRHA438_Chr06g0263231 [Helianthus annuus]|nr:uncharacterized protein LOC110863901 [Helianthus annuus]KAF5801940.1 hypothetical protein HanXRQr2_Chr06g0253951 [Helianthus annuus]KAJ0566416.1 hypothetical protein HanIR_Chr06g0273531 [Helianthus annuus]KAJ0911439.1 hypothetical protein HanRHA438_Chr06g0263231 [Helianthus annuus]
MQIQRSSSPALHLDSVQVSDADPVVFITGTSSGLRSSFRRSENMSGKVVFITIASSGLRSSFRRSENMSGKVDSSSGLEELMAYEHAKRGAYDLKLMLLVALEWL